MKILSNKEYNQLILKSCRGMFGAVNDDMLLRNCGAMQQEIDNYKNILVELEEWLKLVMGNASLKWGENCAREFDLGCLDIEMTMKNYGEVLNKIQELKEKYK